MSTEKHSNSVARGALIEASKVTVDLRSDAKLITVIELLPLDHPFRQAFLEQYLVRIEYEEVVSRLRGESRELHARASSLRTAGPFSYFHSKKASRLESAAREADRKFVSLHPEVVYSGTRALLCGKMAVDFMLGEPLPKISENALVFMEQHRRALSKRVPDSPYPSRENPAWVEMEEFVQDLVEKATETYD